MLFMSTSSTGVSCIEGLAFLRPVGGPPPGPLRPHSCWAHDDARVERCRARSALDALTGLLREPSCASQTLERAVLPTAGCGAPPPNVCIICSSTLPPVSSRGCCVSRMDFGCPARLGRMVDTPLDTGLKASRCRLDGASLFAHHRARNRRFVSARRQCTM